MGNSESIMHDVRSGIITAEAMVDGAVVRVFHNGEDWQVSTHRRINAKNSRFGSTQSFKGLFFLAGGSEVLRILAQSGVRGFTYIFTVEHPSRLNVVPVYTPRLQFVGVVHNDSGATHEPGSMFEHVGVTVPERFDTDKIEHFLRLYRERKYTVPPYITHLLRGIVFRKAGVSACVPYARFKVDFPDFVVGSELRGNCENLVIAYTRSLTRGRPLDVLTYFPTFSDSFHEYAMDYDNLARRVATTVTMQSQFKMFKVPKRHVLYSLCTLALRLVGESWDPIDAAYWALYSEDPDVVYALIRLLKLRDFVV
ncbi:hypothetical protein HDU93_006187 [Gonapodya sp. JEL0774]|nr:hypothetical protein HDU93_006187 [Gonapodya sp. JEL0774]